MPFTSQLGTAQSQLGNIELGAGAPPPPPAQPVLSCVSTMFVQVPILGVPWVNQKPIARPFNRQPPPPPVPGSTSYLSSAAFGPPILGVPWRWTLPYLPQTASATRLPPAPVPKFQPLGLVGAPVRGVPFLAPFMFQATATMNVRPQAAPQVGSSSYLPSQRLGVPILGVPWTGLAGMFSQPAPVGPKPPLPVPPPPPNVPTGRPSGVKPFIVTDPAASDRTRRHLDQTSSLLNSLLRTGIIQLAPNGEYVIRAGGYTMDRPPTVMDDLTIGVVPGVQWVDTTNGTAYININNSAGSAVWKQIT